MEECEIDIRRRVRKKAQQEKIRRQKDRWLAPRATPSKVLEDQGASAQNAIVDPQPRIDPPAPKEDDLVAYMAAHQAYGKGLSCHICSRCEHFPPPSGEIVFLCHTRQDAIGKSLTGHLADNMMRMGYRTFYDVWSLAGGDEWMQCIEQCVRSSHVFVCLLTESFWFRYVCMHELDIALRSNRVIIPVCLDGDPPNVDDLDFRDLFYATHANNPGGHPVDKQLLDQWLRNIKELGKFNWVYHYPGPKDSEVQLKWKTTCSIRNQIHGDGGIGDQT